MPRVSSLGYLLETIVSIPVPDNVSMEHQAPTIVPQRERLVCFIMIAAVTAASVSVFVVAVLRSSM